MSIRKESKEETYDVIIIGSGMGGLTAGALAAKVGKRVLVIERHARAGGCAHSFKRKKYIFDSAVHLIGGCETIEDQRSGLIDQILTIIGTRDQCDFIKVDHFYDAHYPDLHLTAPTNAEAFTEAHAELFPAERDGLLKLMSLMSGLNQEARRFPATMSIWDTLKMPLTYPALVRNGRATVQEVLDKCLTDERLKSLISSIWPYLGMPPSKLSFAYWALMMASYFDEGAFYCRGSFQKMADAFVAGLKNHGGEILLGTAVRRILIENKHAVGVVLENGQRIRAKHVISNADAMQTFEELVGVEHLPNRYVRNLRKMTPSLSAIVIYLATSLDMKQQQTSHEVFGFDSWDHDTTYSAMVTGKQSGYILTTPTLVDPTLAPEGEHIVTLMTLADYNQVNSWRLEKEQRVEQLLNRVEQAYPHFRDHLLFYEGATPRTVERYTLNSSGAIYGWAMTPAQSGTNRLAQTTPLEGLSLTGHWTRPGGGIYGVVASGMQAAQHVLEYETQADMFAALY